MGSVLLLLKPKKKNQYILFENPGSGEYDLLVNYIEHNMVITPLATFIDDIATTTPVENAVSGLEYASTIALMPSDTHPNSPTATLSSTDVVMSDFDEAPFSSLDPSQLDLSNEDSPQESLLDLFMSVNADVPSFFKSRAKAASMPSKEHNKFTRATTYQSSSTAITFFSDSPPEPIIQLPCESIKPVLKK